MLAMTEDIWWRRIHREVIDQARVREQCLESGKDLKHMFQQNKGKKPEAKEQNEEVALDFAGLFQNAKKEKSTY